MSEFPSLLYSNAQKGWIGKEHIVLPTVLRAINYGELIRNKRVLDVGCGTGHLSQLLLINNASSVVGIDSSHSIIQVALKMYQNDPLITFYHKSITEYSMEGFHVAVAFFVLEFIMNKNDLLKALKNIFNSLSEDGVLVAIVPNGIPEFNPISEEGKKFGAAVEVPNGKRVTDGQHLPINFYENGEIIGSSTIALYFRETYEDLMEATGFKRIEWLPPVISDDGQRIYGESFFETYLNPPKNVILRAYKSKSK